MYHYARNNCMVRMTMTLTQFQHSGVMSDRSQVLSIWFFHTTCNAPEMKTSFLFITETSAQRRKTMRLYLQWRTIQKIMWGRVGSRDCYQSELLTPGRNHTRHCCLTKTLSMNYSVRLASQLQEYKILPFAPEFLQSNLYTSCIIVRCPRFIVAQYY